MTPDEINYRVALATCAASWWADVLREGQAPSLTRDAGHTSTASLWCDAFVATRHREQAKPSAIDAFETRLRDAVVERLLTIRAEPDGHWYGASLNVDYDPCPMLREAARAACVPQDFPFKTRMWIDSSGVSVSRGYRGDPMWLCATKKAIVYDSLRDRLEATFSDENYEAWSNHRKRAINVASSLPDFPEGDVHEIADRILSEAA